MANSRLTELKNGTALTFLAAESVGGLADDARRLRDGLRAGQGVPSPGPVGDGKARLALIADSSSDMADKLDAAIERLDGASSQKLPEGVLLSGAAPRDAGKIAFLFPGVGAHYPSLVESVSGLGPDARSWFASPADSLPDPDMVALLTGLAVHESLRASGVPCGAMAGFSNGENAALFAGDRFRFSSRPEMIERISRFVAELTQTEYHSRTEASASISVHTTDRARLAETMTPYPAAYFAIDCCPSQCVLTGSASEIDSLRRVLEDQGTICIQLPHREPFHTPLFARHTDAIRGWYASCDTSPANVPVYSSATARPYPDDPEGLRETVLRLWTEPVRFQDTIRALYDEGVRTFIQVGPGQTLLGFVTNTLGRKACATLPSIVEGKPALTQVQTVLARLFVSGVDVRPLNPSAEPVPAASDVVTAGTDVRARMFHQHHNSAREFLASQTRTFGTFAAAVSRSRETAPPHRDAATPVALDGCAPRPLRAGDVAPVRSLPQDATPEQQKMVEFQRTFSLETDPWLADHCLGRRRGHGVNRCEPLPVCPFTVGMEILADAAREVVGDGLPLAAMENVRSYRWISLENGSVTVTVRAKQAEVRADGSRVVDAGVFSISETGAEGEPIFRGRVVFSAGPPRTGVMPHKAAACDTVPPLPSDVQPFDWDAGDIYARFLFHGPAFHSIRAVTGLSPNGIEAVTADPRAYHAGREVPAVLLDATGQLLGCWFRLHDPHPFGAFPFQIDRYVPLRPISHGTPLRCIARTTLDGALLRGDFDFIGDDGERIMAVRGLALRYFAFSERFARCLFRDGDYGWLSEVDLVHDGVEATLRISDLGVLRDGGGIFAMALAHYVLTPSEREAYARSGQISDLLRLIAVKEAAARWLSNRHGQAVFPPAVDAVDEDNIRVAGWDGELPSITVGVTGDQITAHAGDPARILELSGAAG